MGQGWGYTKILPSLQFFRINLSLDLGIKCHNLSPAQSLSVILVLHHQPLPAMSEMGQLLLQTMSTACPQPLPIMLGAPFFLPQIIVVSRLPLLFITHEMTLFPLLVTSRSLDVSDVNLNSFVGLAKEFTLLVCAQLLSGYQKRGAHPRAFLILRPLWFLLTPLLL
jgi:hypothetical protein